MTPTADTEHRLREAVVATAREMNALGINRGKSGNVSARWRDGDVESYLITPSAMPYASIAAADVVPMPIDGEHGASGTRRPSSEWRFHRDIYRARPDAQAAPLSGGRPIRASFCGFVCVPITPRNGPNAPSNIVVDVVGKICQRHTERPFGRIKTTAV